MERHIDIDFDELDRTIVKDADVLWKIVRNSHPDIQNGKGFWLFASEFEKDPAYLEFGEDSPWDPTYFVYTDYNDNIVAMRGFRIKDPILPNYAHMIAMQVLSQYKGNYLSEGIVNDTKEYIKRNYPNIVGFTLECFEPSLERLCRKMGYVPFEKDGIRYMKLDFKKNEDAGSMRHNILYPGKFKPVHDGHISIIDKWLNEENTYVYVIISKKEHQGLSPYTSKWFLDEIFGQYRNFVAVVTDFPSPVQAVYHYTATKEFGDGIYAMASSTKEGDSTRTSQFINNFREGGKYYTPGVYANEISSESPVMFTARDDDFLNSPISSTILREDLINHNLNRFMSGYEMSFRKGILDPELVEEYYNRLEHEIIAPRLTEGGAAGHMSHPYENNDMTFQDIYNMIDDLFNGKITDITEKLDGINIFASVDSEGRTVFARNKTQLRNAPMLMDDMINNDKWLDNIKQTFIKGAETIDAVFSNIPNKVRFFNYDDGNGTTYRKWCNIEIIDHDSVNVIPYVDNLISFHTIWVATFGGEWRNFETFIDPDVDADMSKIETAISKTNNTVFKAQLTPKVIIRQNNALTAKLNEYSNELEDIIYHYKLNPESTLTDYRRAAYWKFLMSNDSIRKELPGTREDYANIADRWSGAKKIDLRVFEPNLRNKIKTYETLNLKKLSERIMLPINKFFVNLGNDVIRMCDGMTNNGIQDKVIEKLKAGIVNTIDDITKNGDKNQDDRLEYLLVRLGDQTNLNASEGIVFTYRGHTYKLTGSFNVLNDIMWIRRKES